MPTEKELRRRIEKNQDDTEKRVESFLADLKRFIDSALEEIVGEIADGNIEPALALGSLVESFRARGLSSVVGELSTIYGAELGKVLNTLEYQDIANTLQLVDDVTLEALIRFRVEDIENRAIESVGRLRPIILENIINNQRPDIKALSARVDSQLIANTKTEINTALISFNRTVTAVSAEQIGIKRFLYIGPIDKITRPFCSKVLTGRTPPIYSIDEIAGMDNGQNLEALTYGGGYNCRHTWQPVSDALAKELGA